VRIRTDHEGADMSLSGTRVLVLGGELFEDTELLYPLLRLQEEEVDVVLATPGGASITGKKGHGPVEADASFEDVAADDFAAVVIPGGFAPDAVRRSEAALDLVRAFDAAGKPIAFICHAGWVPISAGIVSGRRATSFSAIKDDMVNAGVDWVDEPVVVDGNLISSRHPGDLGPWLKALIAALRD
jgi:protease I